MKHQSILLTALITSMFAAACPEVHAAGPRYTGAAGAKPPAVPIGAYGARAVAGKRLTLAKPTNKIVMPNGSIKAPARSNSRYAHGEPSLVEKIVTPKNIIGTFTGSVGAGISFGIMQFIEAVASVDIASSTSALIIVAAGIGSFAWGHKTMPHTTNGERW